MKKYLLLIGALMFIPNLVYANNNATITLESSDTNLEVGDTITVDVNISSDTAIGYYEYTLDYNRNKLSLLSGSPYYVNKMNNGETKKTSKSFSFKITGEGTSKISVKSYAITSYSTEKSLSVKVNPVTISTEDGSTSLNTNNYLSSLEVEGYKLLPKFNKKTTSYSLDLESDVSKINVIAKPESNKSKVSGDGNTDVLEGENKLEITVTSESGAKRVYTIIINADEKNPINVTIDGKNYTVIKNISTLSAPKDYEIIKITIDDKEVNALYSKTTGYTLVGLKNEEGENSLYIYDKDNNTYTPYNEITIKKISFLPLETTEKFKDYSLYNETINDINIKCYKIKEDSNYCIVYGMNLTTGEKGWYSLDKLENTIQKYNNEIDDYYNEKIDNTKLLIYILSGTTLLFGITTIVFAVKKTRKK